MATWIDLSDESLEAARLLMTSGQYRSAVNRAYYSAYCALTSQLLRKSSTFGIRNNPSHEIVPTLVIGLLPLNKVEKHRINKAFRVLLTMRIDADYRPYRLVNESIARDAVRQAFAIRHLLESGST